MRYAVTLMAVVALEACAAFRTPPISPPAAGSDGGVADEAITVEATGTPPDQGCWDESPCKDYGAATCLPPGTPHHGGKTPLETLPVDILPSACEMDDDCGSVNLVCIGGRCEHRPCTSSTQCSGYCIDETCWSEPGFCEDYLKQ